MSRSSSSSRTVPTTERIKGALAADGWTVQVVADRDAAMTAAAKGAPDLVLVSTAAPGAAEMLRSFGRAHGGPGALALTSGGPGGQTSPDAGDGALAKPFTDEQLRVSVRRCLSRGQKAAAEAAAARNASAGAQLTSQDLFGDLLAEVEEEASRPVRPAPTVLSPAFEDLQRRLGMLAPRPGDRPAGAPLTTHRRDRRDNCSARRLWRAVRRARRPRCRASRHLPRPSPRRQPASAQSRSPAPAPPVAVFAPRGSSASASHRGGADCHRRPDDCSVRLSPSRRLAASGRALRGSGLPRGGRRASLAAPAVPRPRGRP